MAKDRLIICAHHVPVKEGIEWVMQQLRGDFAILAVGMRSQRRPIKKWLSVACCRNLRRNDGTRRTHKVRALVRQSQSSGFAERGILVECVGVEPCSTCPCADPVKECHVAAFGNTALARLMGTSHREVSPSPRRCTRILLEERALMHASSMGHAPKRLTDCHSGFETHRHARAANVGSSLLAQSTPARVPFPGTHTTHKTASGASASQRHPCHQPVTDTTSLIWRAQWTCPTCPATPTGSGMSPTAMFPQFSRDNPRTRRGFHHALKKTRRRDRTQAAEYWSSTPRVEPTWVASLACSS